MLLPESAASRAPTVAQRLAAPPALLAGLLLLAAALRFCPARLLDPARDAWSALLLPSQRACCIAVDWTRAISARIENSFADGERLTVQSAEVAGLRDQNRQLAAALEAARAQIAATGSTTSQQPSAVPL